MMQTVFKGFIRRGCVVPGNTNSNLTIVSRKPQSRLTRFNANVRGARLPWQESIEVGCAESCRLNPVCFSFYFGTLLVDPQFTTTKTTTNITPQVRFNTKTRSIEMKTSQHTLDTGALQKGADFCSAFMLGFEVQDAVALLRLDDLYVESFQVTDVKMLNGDHLSRAIGRVAGQDGKTRFAIENATRTRIVVADQRIHLLGSFANLRVARNAICDLILGAPPGKVYNSMRSVAKRMSERY